MSPRSEVVPLLGPPEDAARLAPYIETLVVAPGTTLVREGADDRDLYIVVSGEAIVRRGDLEVGRIRPGEHFGELGLVVGSPRRATITARTEMTLSRLPLAAFDTLAARDPGLALRLVGRALATVAGWLDDMTRTADALLRERGLPRATHVDVWIDGEHHRVPVGAPLSRLLPAQVDGEMVVAALVDRRATSLVSPILAGGTVEPLTTGHWEGLRVYRLSVGLLLLEAAARFHPELTISLEHSLGYARFVRVEGDVASWPALADELNARMLELVDADLPLREKWWTVDEAREHFMRAGWSSAAELLRTSREPTGRVVTYGQVHAMRIEPVAPRTGMLSGFCVLAAPGGLLLVHGVVDDIPTTPGRTIIAPANERRRAAATIAGHGEKILRAHVSWLDALRVTDVGGLNHACIRGDVSQLIRVSEGYQEKRVGQIADAIAAQRGHLKVVCIAGPSSSGKSTFIKRLRVQLQVDGLHPLDISLDDYYRDRADLSPGPDGELDFEAFEALRSDLLQAHLRRLLAGETVRTARFHFRESRSDPEGGPAMQLQPGTILLLEGIHGLNPQLLETIPGTEVHRVFVCPLAQLPFDRLSRVHASDLRLLRRIVRDRHGRNTDAAASIARWPSVRDGERLHIFAYQHHADDVFDSSLIYELSVLKVFAERYLLEVPSHDPAYTTAFRLLRLLDHFVTIYPDHVPPTSILREFIGGSGFEY